MEISNILGITIGLFLTYFFIRKQRNNYLETCFKMDMFKLRDNLRAKAFENTVKKDSWIFSYFDLTISKLIQESYYISLPFILLADKQHEQDEKNIKKFLQKLDYECKKNPELLELRSDISKTVLKYIFLQQRFSLSHILIICLRFIANLKIGLSKIALRYDYGKRANDIFTLPETSAIYC